MYLQKRRRCWYALHEIPSDLRQKFGRPRFVQSLKTEIKSEAKRRAAVLEVRWRHEIEQARNGNNDHVERDAVFWRKALLDTPEDQRELVIEVIGVEAYDREARAADAAGYLDSRELGYEDLPGVQDARRFFAVATGQVVRMEEHLEEYLATLTLEAKTVDMRRATLKRFFEVFPYVTDVKRKEVQRWVNGLAQEGKAVATIRRSLSELRGYWSYLISIEAASEDNMPFASLKVPRPAKKGKDSDRRPFEPAEVVTLLQAAKNRKRKDQPLVDLICLGMWTGARIEELCALKVADVKAHSFLVSDAKTPSGRREVPIHSKLASTMQRLLKDSTDGYVISGLNPNKYGDRSNAVGKRFGRLKSDAGFGEAHVFHSIRKTVATLLEDAGVPENVAADIIGHEKPTMTYGLYSGGNTLATKREALEKIDYPASV